MAANLSTWTNGSAEEGVVGMSGTRVHPAHLTGSTGAPSAGDTTTHNGCLLVQGDFDPQDNPHNIVNKQVRVLLLLLFSRTFHTQFGWETVVVGKEGWGGGGLNYFFSCLFLLPFFLKFQKFTCHEVWLCGIERGRKIDEDTRLVNFTA